MPLDSHLALPVVETGRARLEAHDFAPFTVLADMPLAMTAHVVYTALDPEHPATSKKVITEVVRGYIGYDGLVLSDDLSMQALSVRSANGPRFLAAGCDVALHCNGKMDEMTAVAEATDPRRRRPPPGRCRLAAHPARTGPFDPVDARARLDAALALAA